MGGRRSSREIAFKTLFHLEFNPEDLDLALERLSAIHGWKTRDLNYARRLLLTVKEKKEQIDNYISTASKNWKFERIANVEKCILRMSIAELLLMDKEVPPKVVIDEAVELSKIFGNGESPSFVNGIMDHVFKNYYGVQDKECSHKQDESQENCEYMKLVERGKHEVQPTAN